MTSVLILAAKEIKDGMRNRWIVMITVLMAGFALVLSLLGSAPSGTTGISELAVTIVSLSSLSIFFIPLIALLLSYDSLVSEIERGTLILLAAHPVARWQIVVGKFLGYLVLLAIAISIGYGSAGLAIGLTSHGPWQQQAWTAFAGLVGSSVLLGAVFLALGLLINVRVRERGTAAGLAIAVWLILVLVYDMGLLGLLAAEPTGGMFDESTVTALLLANPTDTYRMLNLAGSPEVAALSAMTSLGAAGTVSPFLLAGLLCAWTVVPLSLACLIFNGRELQ
jgi:Cu-processing system permease protein